MAMSGERKLVEYDSNGIEKCHKAISDIWDAAFNHQLDSKSIESVKQKYPGCDSFIDNYLDNLQTFVQNNPSSSFRNTSTGSDIAA